MELEIEKSLISCIVSRKGGVPVHELNEDYKTLTGYSIPFLSLGYPTLVSFLSTIKDVYFIKDEDNNDVVIVDSLKSRYMKKLVEKQKQVKRKRDPMDQSTDLDYTISSIQSSRRNYFYHVKRRRATLLKKEIMDILTPTMYGYQLMGDDVLLEIAENHLMVSIDKTAPKRCGLCIAGQTIKDLIDNIDSQSVLPCRIAILIGLADLLNGKKSIEMTNEMDFLITELRSRNIKATIFTLPKLSCIPKSCYSILKTFNDYIISQENEIDSITVMNLEQYYAWMTYKERDLSKHSGSLLHEKERTVILSGLQDHFTYINVDNEK